MILLAMISQTFLTRIYAIFTLKLVQSPTSTDMLIITLLPRKFYTTFITFHIL